MKSIRRILNGNTFHFISVQQQVHYKGYERFFIGINTCITNLCFCPLPRHHYNLLSQLKGKTHIFLDRLGEDLITEEDKDEIN